MTISNPQEYEIPSTQVSFRFSRASLGFIIAAVLLAGLTGFSTYNNIRRGQDLMEHFLLKKGETIIRSIEAGTRSSMMHNMRDGNLLNTLITENIKDNGIAFIRIVSDANSLIYQAGNRTGTELSAEQIEQILKTGRPVTEFDNRLRIFTVSDTFQAESHDETMGMAGGHMMFSPETSASARKRIISIGLVTDEFDAVRRHDVQHALFMGGILLLIGIVGIYFLFLYHKIRIAKSTLADMKLYTDNVIESIPAGLITLDEQDRLVSCNRKAEEIFQRSDYEMHGLNIKEILTGCSITREDIRKSVIDRSDELTTAADTQVPIQISGSRLINTEGQAIGTVLIIRDMSTVREMEQQLERSRRMMALGKMAAGIAHEIRNPLGTLRGFAQYFGSLSGATDECRAYANLMISEVDRLNRNVSGLLQFARPREPQLVMVNLDEVLAKTMALMVSDFTNHSLQLEWQRDTGITVTADPDMLLQVLMNLLKNSIHATPPGGRVDLTCTEDAYQVRIRIADSGCGMNENEREKMFDPFFTTGKTGTGLGLTVSHHIIEQHQGVFEVESAPGKGTAITLVLRKVAK